VTASAVDELRAGRFDDGEVAVAKEWIKGSLLLNLESAEYRMSRLAMNEMFLGGQESPDDELRRVDEVTAEQVRRLAASMLDRERFSLAAVGDLPKGPDLVF
jgi:predicted Zn-dependent peptidase